MFLTQRKFLILIGLIILGAFALSYWRLGNIKKSEEVRIVEDYLEAYRKPNLKTVRKAVSSEMLERLPGTQKEFSESVKEASKQMGRIKSWQVINAETNPYVGQTMVDVAVVTDKQNYVLVFDVFKEGAAWKIRAVKDKAAENFQNGTYQGDTYRGMHGQN